MSRVTHKDKRSKKHIEAHKQKVVLAAKQQRQKDFVVFVIIAILTAIPFSMGKYFEFNSPGPYDSGAYVYSAKHILDGAEIGVEEKPSAQLGTLLFNMLGVWLCGFNETGPKLAQAILQAAALLLMFVAARKLFGTLPAAVCVIVASVYLSAPLIAKFGNVKEQYMIAFMVMGISCFVLYQLGGKWWYAFLAGAFVSWAPLFKQTGVSAIGAIGLFVVLQPLLKNRTPKQTGLDILLLLAGAAAAIAPLYVWMIAWNVQMSLPYSFLWQTLAKLLPAGADSEPAKAATDYVSGSRKLVSFSKQWPIVLRYYGSLILPIALATGALAARMGRMLLRLKIANRKSQITNRYDRFVLLFAAWWLLDMALVWISPHSYEQYYLPLNASAAMLGGYLIAVYCDKFSKSAYKGRWVLIGTAGFVCMIIMSWHIFFGIEKRPHSGISYGEKRRGYAQKLDEISQRRKKNRKGYWEVAGEYIRTHSEPTDKIYVWGWVPGIYVKAQRLSSATRAFTSTMHIIAPVELAEMVAGLLSEFEREPPKFVVDTHNIHFPYDGRPPLELWPIMQYQILKNQSIQTTEPDKAYAEWLTKNVDSDEAGRFRAMRPFREFVMKNYRVVQAFGQQVLFELKSSASEDPA
jgi:4-amino-4-deoxy-L-arabinose transferase-like glycosyltransferase